MNTEDIDALKHHPSDGARFAYKLKNANVHVSPQGFHFTDYLDPVEEIPTEIDASQLTAEESESIYEFHELSFPYEFYLKKLFRSQLPVNILLPFVHVFFKLFKIQNKMLVIGRRRFDFASAPLSAEK